MRGNLLFKKVQTAYGAIAEQLVRYTRRKGIIVRHISSSRTNEELTVLCREAEVEAT